MLALGELEGDPLSLPVSELLDDVLVELELVLEETFDEVLDTFVDEDEDELLVTEVELEEDELEGECFFLL